MTMQGVKAKKVKFSIVIPAYNEEKYITKCLDSILKASVPYKDQVEIIVVLNRCTDRTEEIALLYGCIIVKEDSKNLSKIRNAGAKVAQGTILVTIDADSWIADNMLAEIESKLITGEYIGGGVVLKTERMSLGIMISAIILFSAIFIKHGLICGGLFWCLKKDFDAINGFDENLRIAEDIDFAIRLRQWGKKCGKKVTNISKPRLMTSCRKFDIFGDWYVIKNPHIILDYLNLNKQKYADKLYYDVKR
ncbi:glycosyltransferase [Sporomusa aerivorans]|uniref:glycosyltransferase n=1 Tax=Sporomusa aerivorans TaxID=204936 RepID=UPI00352A0398